LSYAPDYGLVSAFVGTLEVTIHRDWRMLLPR